MKIAKFLDKVTDVIDKELEREALWDDVEISENNSENGFILRHDRYGRVPGEFLVIDLYTDFNKADMKFKEYAKERRFRDFKRDTIKTLNAFIAEKESRNTRRSTATHSENRTEPVVSTEPTVEPVINTPVINNPIICPRCESTHFQRRGRKNGKQRCRCMDCGRWFRV